MSYKYVIFNKFPELKIINHYDRKYMKKDDYLSIDEKDLENIEVDKITWVMVFKVNSRFTRFIEKLD
jgi:hypothetical protein